MAWSWSLKRRLAAGLVVIAPAAVTAFVLWRVFLWLDGLLGRWLYSAIGQRVPGLGIVALFLILLAFGWLAERAIGARIVEMWHALLARIPLYPAATRVFRSMFGGNRRPFREVVLVRLPGRWSVGFVTAPVPHALEQHAPGAVTVFVPRSPNLYTGELVIVSREHAIPLEMTPEEAFTFFLSAGAIAAEEQDRPAVDRKARAPEGQGAVPGSGNALAREEPGAPGGSGITPGREEQGAAGSGNAPAREEQGAPGGSGIASAREEQGAAGSGNAPAREEQGTPPEFQRPPARGERGHPSAGPNV